MQPSDVKTDAGGRFELTSQNGQPNTVPCIMARDVEHNLAVAREVEEDSGPLDLTLAPGVTVVGSAVSDGKPVENSAGTVVFWVGNSGMHLTGLSRKTGTPGQFEIPTLPPGRRLGILASAQGYGPSRIQDVFTDDATDGRMEAGPLELKPANLKLAGQVVDSNDNPVRGATVYINGEGQPGANAHTDREGRFVIEHICEGRIQISANALNTFGNVAAEGGDTNVMVRLGSNAAYGGGSAVKPRKVKGTVTDPNDQPVSGAQVAVFPSGGAGLTKTSSNGAFNLTWGRDSWQRESARLVARDLKRNLAASEDLSEDTTNLSVKLKPALTLCGRVNDTGGKALARAQVNIQIRTGGVSESLDNETAVADSQGRFEIKGLAGDARYMVFATRTGYGRGLQNVEADSDTNRMELLPFVLKLAGQIVAGQVVNDQDKPLSGVNVSNYGDDQPGGSVTTDSKGRFQFKVCEGQIQINANSQEGYAQVNAQAGQTNIVITLRSQGAPQTVARHTFKGKALPGLETVNLETDAAPAGKPVLLCLFDASQRPSRHVVSQLEQQAAGLRQQGITVLGVQAAITTDDIFNQWKSGSPVSFPIGRVTEKNAPQAKWASNASALPWLILTDAKHQVVAEGFAMDDLDAQIKKMAK
jgi:protocatechuate 3,4-dioxygenase beta subunit